MFRNATPRETNNRTDVRASSTVTCDGTVTPLPRPRYRSCASAPAW